MITDKKSVEPKCLYVVSTPIGNLGDITLRALEVLKSVDLILAEDTRVSAKLLNHYQIQTQLTAFHDHNESKRIDSLLQQLQRGKAIALISDAGTPLISDPGFKLIRACREQGISVVPVPGAAACIAALSVSGLPSDRFTFIGFLPTQAKAKQIVLESIQASVATTILYESPRRVLGLLQELNHVLESERKVCIARELTKHFETVYTGTITDVLAWYEADPEQHRGEFVLLISAKLSVREESLDEESLRILGILAEQLPTKQAAKLAQSITGLPQKLLYQAALTLKS